jgi:hypothetical protein
VYAIQLSASVHSRDLTQLHLTENSVHRYYYFSLYWAGDYVYFLVVPDQEIASFLFEHVISNTNDNGEENTTLNSDRSDSQILTTTTEDSSDAIEFSNISPFINSYQQKGTRLTISQSDNGFFCMLFFLFGLLFATVSLLDIYL